MRTLLRTATLADTAEINRLTGQLGYTATEAETSQWLTWLLQSAHHQVIVATNDTSSTLLGWIVVERRVTLESGIKAEITGLVVSTAARRTGVGRTLVRAAETWVIREGLNSIGVRSNVKRVESHLFYQGLGFTQQKTSHYYSKTVV